MTTKTALVIAAIIGLASTRLAAQATSPTKVPTTADVVVRSTYPGDAAARVLEIDGAEVERLTTAFTGGEMVFTGRRLSVGLHHVRVGACNDFGCAYSPELLVEAGAPPSGSPTRPTVSVVVTVQIP